MAGKTPSTKPFRSDHRSEGGGFLIFWPGVGILVKRAAQPLAVLGLAACLTGCMTMTLEGDGMKTPRSEHGRHTVHGSYYGFVWSEPPVSKCENGRGLYRVRTHTNVVYSLVSIVSLGLYVPQTAEWWCDGAPAADENEESYVPGN